MNENNDNNQESTYTSFYPNIPTDDNIEPEAPPKNKQKLENFLFSLETLVPEVTFVAISTVGFILPAFFNDFAHLTNYLPILMPVWVGITALSFLISGVAEAIDAVSTLAGEQDSLSAKKTAYFWTYKSSRRGFFIGRDVYGCRYIASVGRYFFSMLFKFSN